MKDCGLQFKYLNFLASASFYLIKMFLIYLDPFNLNKFNKKNEKEVEEPASNSPEVLRFSCISTASLVFQPSVSI